MHFTGCNATQPFYDFHMGPMSDDAVSNQLMSPHLCQAMSLFMLQLAKSLALCCHICKNWYCFDAFDRMLGV
jgi:hypothetical protein